MNRPVTVEHLDTLDAMSVLMDPRDGWAHRILDYPREFWVGFLARTQLVLVWKP